ncbi:hypothetical protein E4T39_03723 [Aureobasidium subglaciale]|nr:hypothetical protein E4T39_03723 [Aureobasidium subglaciale]
MEETRSPINLKKTMQSLVSAHGHKEDLNDKATCQREIMRWSLKHTVNCAPSTMEDSVKMQYNADMTISQLGFNIHQQPESSYMLAQQVYRWCWEVENVQACGPNPHLPYHPVRAAWLWMEEYGAELWPADIGRRGHLYPSTTFVYLRDRNGYIDLEPDQRLDVDENIAGFCFSKGTLHPYNDMFQKVLQYFAGMQSGMWSHVEKSICRARTAAELMADFLGSEPWMPEQRGFIPLYYVEDDTGSCSSDDSTPSSMPDANSQTSGFRISTRSGQRTTASEPQVGSRSAQRSPESPTNGMDG